MVSIINASFIGCAGLTLVTVSVNVEEIEISAFENC